MDIRFADLDAEASDATVFGGKAAGLARLNAAGARTPDGFAISVTAVEMESWSVSARDDFLDRARRLLELGPIAVRSSAALEDSATQSFAGQFESVLGVATIDDAMAAVDRCIASGRSERVRAYRGVDEPLPVGIVVESMIEPRAAGVCFTTNPTGDDRAVVIEAVEGRGDRLVSGAADPERWRLYMNGVGAWEARCRKPSVLTIAEATSIAAESRRLEEAIGFPLDLEWAIDSSGITWMLQARPVTVAATPPEWVIERSVDDVEDGPVTLWSNWNVKETMPEPLFPLAWTLWRDEITPMVSDLLYGIKPGTELSRVASGLDLVHGRVYFNMNAMLGIPILGRFMPRLAEIMDSRTAAVLQDLTASGTVLPRRGKFSRIEFGAGTLKAMLVSLVRARTALSPTGAMRRLDRGAASIARRPDIATLSDSELVEELRIWNAPACADLRYGLLMEAVAMLVYGMARRAFRDHPEALNHLATGIPANPTTKISLAVEHLTDRARGLESEFEKTAIWPELGERLSTLETGRAWLAELDSFLESYGHRGPREFDIGAGRWSEDPSMIVDLVRIGLASPAAERMSERLVRLAHQREKLVGDAIKASAPWRRPLMRILARLVRSYMPLREAPKHYGVVVFQRIRNAARELGRRLVSRGVLGTEMDVFFLELPELVAVTEGKPPPDDLDERIALRKTHLDQFRASQAPDMLRSDGVPVEEEEHEELEANGALRGVGVAPGIAKGPVCVLGDPDPRAMSEGDVLVVKFADPGWTPLFPRAAAVVMEIGGLMCHAAVVARELGVPAVFGVRDATTLLDDGEIVEVDGGAGKVKRAIA